MKYIITHYNADLDALACLIAAQRLFGATPLGGSIVSPPVKRFLALHKDRFALKPFQEVDASDVDELIVVDVRDQRRLKEFQPIIDAAKTIRTYDHHPDSEHDVKGAPEKVEPVGACITLLVEELVEAGFEIEPDDATLFLLGLYSDTGRLSYSNTLPRDVAVAELLLRSGANLKVVNRYLRREFTPGQAKLLVEMMNTAEEESFDAVEVAFASARAEKFVRGVAPVVQQVLDLGGHDAIFGVVEFEKSKRVQIIGRSSVTYLDVGEILSKFGGGGHRGAAAAILKKTDLETVMADLRQTIRDYPMTPRRVSELMSSPVHTLQHDATLEQAQEQMANWVITGAPVMRDGELTGVISIRDVQRAAKADKLHLPVASHMTHQVTCIDHHEPVEDTLELMTAEDIGRLPVTRDGEIVGIITRTDLLRELYMREADESEIAAD